MTARPTKRNPTNAEILGELHVLQSKVTPLVRDVDTLMQWKRDQEIAKTAVAEYVAAQPKKPNQGSNEWLNRELVKMLGVAFAIILALVSLLTQLKVLGK